MFLFIFESIGTSELILIGVVALIVFGPRKLPQMAKTIGKTMAEFRNATNEFKSTWEKEANFEGIEKNISLVTEPNDTAANNHNSNNINLEQKNETSFPNPVIKELSASDIAERFHSVDKLNQFPKAKEKSVEEINPGKQDWL